MWARIVQLATPRRIVAAECCVAGLGAGAAVLAIGPSPLALALLAACTLTMMWALHAAARLEKRSSRD